MSKSMGAPHGGGQEPSHYSSQKQASRGTMALAPQIGHLPGDGDGLRLDGTVGSVSNLVEFNCNIGY